MEDFKREYKTESGAPRPARSNACIKSASSITGATRQMTPVQIRREQKQKEERVGQVLRAE